MPPIINFQKEAENETVTFEFSGPAYPRDDKVTVTMNQIIQGWTFRNCQEDVNVPGHGWKKIDAMKSVYFSEFFPNGEAFHSGYKKCIKVYDRSFLEGFYRDMAKATAKKLIEINVGRLISERERDTAKNELLNVNNLLLEEKVKAQIAENSVINLKNIENQLLNKLDLTMHKLDESLTEVENLHAELEKAQISIEDLESNTREHKAVIINLKHTVEDMDITIATLKDEKIDFSNQIINLKSNFKIEKIEFKRRLKEFEDMNYFLLSELRKKNTNSQQASYATSDDEG